MRKANISLLSLALAGTFSAFAFPAMGSQPHSSVDINATTLASSLGVSAVSSAQLSKIRGGFGVVGAVNLGINTGNSADNSITGSITNGQSVNGNTGLTTVIQNTGNNSLLQSSMTVNITVH